MKVLLSYGMGVDSTAILLRWLEESASRPFKSWDELVILTAQVGDEWPDTKIMVEGEVYPRLRAKGIRTIQVARSGHHEKDGVSVLADAKEPFLCFTDGIYPLAEEYLRTGTLPQYATGCRRCTHKAKGVPLDTWIKDNVREGYLHVIGYNAGEQKRADRGEGYTALGELQRTFSYPLIEWGWGRQKCVDYIREVTGVEWGKSCCTFCPFATEEGVMGRFYRHPEQAAEALYLEYQALALNPRSTLYKNRSLYETMEKNTIYDFSRARKIFRDFLHHGDWALYHIRRVVSGGSHRCVEIADRGTRTEMTNSLLHFGKPDADDQFLRVWMRRKGDEQPWGEEMLVALPLQIEEKSRPGFEARWDALTGEDR